MSFERKADYCPECPTRKTGERWTSFVRRTQNHLWLTHNNPSDEAWEEAISRIPNPRARRLWAWER